MSLSGIRRARLRRGSGNFEIRLRRLRRGRLIRAMAELRLHNPKHSEFSSIDKAMMERAIRLADQAAAMGEVPIGAVVYRDGKVIAEAFNIRETNSDPAGHAEILALTKAGKALGEWRLNDCSLAVTLEPCPMCAGAIVNARIGRLIYGTTDPKAGACETLYRIPTDSRLNHRVQMIGGVLAEKCKKQLQTFFRQRREANKVERAKSA